MALHVYSKDVNDNYVLHSEDGAQTKPIITVHHGRDGTTQEIELYVRADDEGSYSNIQITATTSGADDIGWGDSRGTTGWGVKLMVDAGITPTETDWAALEYGNTIDITDITSSSDVRTFWYRLESPRNISVQMKQNISLQLLYTVSGPAPIVVT